MIDRIILITLFILLILQAVAFAEQTQTPTSASYSITVGVFESAGVTGESSNYEMTGKTREREIATPFMKTGAYKLLDGFFRSIFKPTVFGPDIEGISPLFGYNDTTVRVTITGSEFTGTTTVELRMGAEVIGGTIISSSEGQIVVDFDLRGAPTGNYDIWVIRDDYQSDSFSYFEIRTPGLKLVGTPLNFPNPFDPRKEPTEIRYTLTEDADITLYIFNILGERIATFKFFAGQPNGGQQGENIVLWGGDSRFGGLLPSGVYICQITSRNKVLGTVKIAILK